MSKHVITVINCIVGVSVLAMPFCFKQCGVVLASILLLLSGIMTRTVCYFLLKASTITRRRTYELLAYHTFGQAGKLVVEISIIGFLIGTLIAFLVVIGDLGPQILSDVFSIENNPSLRSIVMTALSLFVALPLGLLRNIDSLNAVSSLTMLFYIFLVCKILSDGMGPLWSGSFLTKINYWRPSGVLQCIPIFSMALSCQTQIFGIYDNLPEPSVQKMCDVIRKAINMCTLFYITVGFLGYIAFCTQNFGGNILLSFGPSWSTQVIKLCFVMSIAFSFPLVIFPCRASLHSLVFKRDNLHHHLHDITTNYIPESRLKMLTVVIIMFTLCVGLLIPNIELVLGIVGSTTGSVICIIFPSIMFIRVTSKSTTERLLAQTVFSIGVVIMVVTTFVTLSQVNDSVEIPNSFEKTNIGELASRESRIDHIDVREPFVNPPILLDKNNENKDIIEGKPSNKLIVEKVVKPEASDSNNNSPLDNPNNNNNNNKIPIPTKNVTFTKLKSSSPHAELKSKLDLIDHEQLHETDQRKEDNDIKTPIENVVHEEQKRKEKVEKMRVEKVQTVDHHTDDLKTEEKKPKDPEVHNNNENNNIPNPDKVEIPKKDETLESRKVSEGSKLIDNTLNENQKVLPHHEVEKTQNSSNLGSKKEQNEKKLKEEETLLKKLQEHEEQQKLLLAEQKAILEKLKQHQADDELKQQQQKNVELTNNQEQQKESNDDNNNNLNKPNPENQVHEKVIKRSDNSSIMNAPKRNEKENLPVEHEKVPVHENQQQSAVNKETVQNKVEISNKNNIQVNDQLKLKSENVQIEEKVINVHKNNEKIEENIIEKKKQEEKKKEEVSIQSQSKIKVDRDI